MLAAVLVCVLFAAAGVGVHIGSAVVARHRAQSAADLAALAGASAVPQGAGSACAAAQALAHAMAAQVIDCRVDALDVVITVGVGRASAVARAGPVEHPTSEGLRNP